MTRVTDALLHMFSERNRLQAIQLKAGQIIHGEIINLLSDKEAIVVIQGKKCLAKLEASLQSGQKAWFMVEDDPKQIKLKLLTMEPDISLVNKANPLTDTKSLLRYLELPVNNINKQLIDSFIDQQIPLDKNVLQIAANLLKESGITDVVQAVKLLMQKNLPRTEVHLQAILEFFQKGLIQKIEQLNQQIQSFTENSLDLRSSASEGVQLKLEQLYQKGIEVVQFFQLDSTEFNTDGPKIEKQLTEIILLRLNSFFEEIGIKETTKLEAKIESQYKELITSLLKEANQLPENIKSSLNKVSHHLLGQLLLTTPSIDTQQPFHHVILQVPGMVPFTNEGITLQIQSQKKNGKLDLEDIQLAFLFYLPHLGEVITKIQIIKKNLMVQVINDHPLIKPIVKELEPSFLDIIHAKGYKTTGISISAKKRLNKDSFLSSYQGVDIRV